MEKIVKSSPQREAERLQYTLRSTFFYRQRLHFKKILKEVGQLDSSKYEWDPPSELGISQSSLRSVESRGIPPCEVFCHPEVIISRPLLIAYYRCIAAIPQKGLQRLAFGVQSLEEEKGHHLTKKRAFFLAKTLNTYISSLVDGDHDFSLEDARLVAIMNFGTQINGSWRNEIGIEGSRRVKELLLKHFLDAGLVSEVLSKGGAAVSPAPLPEIDEIGGFVVTSSYRLVFGSEPDVSILSSTGIVDAVIEVKAGVDPAGALERYGAAKKSFDKALRENKAATTIYLV